MSKRTRPRTKRKNEATIKDTVIILEISSILAIFYICLASLVLSMYKFKRNQVALVPASPYLKRLRVMKLGQLGKFVRLMSRINNN